MKTKIGKRIRTLTALKSAALNRKSVVCPWSRCWNKPRPAAFVINLQGHYLECLLVRGIWIYETAKTKRNTK